jgi:hypothetical protein
MIGAHLNHLIARRMASTGGDYVSCYHRLMAENAPAARAYAAGVETTGDLAARLRKALDLAQELLSKAAPGYGAGSATSLSGAISYARELVLELDTIDKFGGMPSYHVDGEIAKLSRKVGHLEARLIDEARGVAADGAGVASYSPPTQRSGRPSLPTAASSRAFGIVLGDDRRG